MLLTSLNKDEPLSRDVFSRPARVAPGFSVVSAPPTGGQRRVLGGIAVRGDGACGLTGSSFGPIGHHEGDGGCSDGPEVMA